MLRGSPATASCVDLTVDASALAAKKHSGRSLTNRRNSDGPWYFTFENDSCKILLLGPSDSSQDVSWPSVDTAILRGLTTRADGSAERARSVSELIDQNSPVGPSGLASTTDGPGRLFPPKPVARTARTACQKANSVRLRIIVKHLWKHAFVCHFVIETKGCVERTNPRVLGCRQSAFGAATAVRSCADSAFNWFRAFSCCSRIVWGKSLSVVKKEPARIVTVSTCFSSASAFPRTSCVAFIRKVRLGHGCLVALLVVDEPRIFLARAGPRASVAS